MWVHTWAMTRRGDEEIGLEVIDLASERERPAGPSTTRRTRSPSHLRAGAIALAVVIALLVSVAIANGRTRGHPAKPSPPRAVAPEVVSPTALPAPDPAPRPRGPIPGRYYPALRRADTATFTLPSGRTVALSGDRASLAGLGATFDGSVVPRNQPVPPPCCLTVPVNFQIFHAAPNVFFQIGRAGVVSTPLLLTPAQAKAGVDGLRGGEYRFAVLSTGDWTLVVSLLTYQAVLSTGLLHGWHLRSTPNGAVLELPADLTIGDDSVMLGRAPDLSDRDVAVTENGCPAASSRARSLNQSATHGGWCQHGLLVRIEGPESYAGVAVANLHVKVTPGP